MRLQDGMYSTPSAVQSSQEREQALFRAAVQLTVTERGTFLKGACLGDDALRHRLEALLSAHDEPHEVSPKRAPAAVALALILGVIVSGWQVVRAKQAQAQALTEKANAQAALQFIQDDVLSQASPGYQPDRELTVRALLDRIAGRLDRATGGFESNLEPVRQHWPTVLPALEGGAKVLLGSGINSLGSGFDVATTGGAGLTNLDHQLFYSTGLVGPARSHRETRPQQFQCRIHLV